MACGYSQIPGVDFQESYDVTFRVHLVTMLTWKLIGKVIDIKSAFLHGDLKETIFMEMPKGMETSKNGCLLRSLAKTQKMLTRVAKVEEMNQEDKEHC